jgi:hypothetical protein
VLKGGIYLGIKYKDSKNPNSVEDGNQFQDLVTDMLFEACGIMISCYSSRKYQYEKGENRQGVEIKLDNWCFKTKRLSVETAEKTAIENAFVESGIYRKDNSIFYVQGNPNIIFVFSKKLLQLLHRSGRYEEKQEATIKTFYLPFEDAYRYAIKVIEL